MHFHEIFELNVTILKYVYVYLHIVTFANISRSLNNVMIEYECCLCVNTKKFIKL